MVGIIAIIAVFIVLPKILFSFLQNIKKNKHEHEIEKLKYQKEILELELEKDSMKIKLLEQENKNLDKIINAD